jgi:polyhydroxyalkanoate synthesis regulator phasin
MAEGDVGDLIFGGMWMSDEETKQSVQDLMRQIQEKSVQLSDLEILIEDYEHERRELLRDIARLKAALWELSTEEGLFPHQPNADSSSSARPSAE